MEDSRLNLRVVFNSNIVSGNRFNLGWMKFWRKTGINLWSVTARARQKSRNHALVALVDPIIGDDASWLSVASNIRNESQHVDATTILIIPYGRGAADPPYLDGRLFPRANMLSRRLDNFCPWLKDQAFQFVEDVSRVLAGAPVL